MFIRRSLASLLEALAFAFLAIGALLGCAADAIDPTEDGERRTPAPQRRMNQVPN
jgi:hypothetical protein